MSVSPLDRTRSALALLATAALLTACGGGSSPTPTAVVDSGNLGSSGSMGGTGSGTVTGFGGLIVDGVRWNDAEAAYSCESDQVYALDRPLYHDINGQTDIPMTSVLLGQSVEFAFDASGRITSALVSPEIMGMVGAVATNSITVLGTPIVANADPALGPATSFVGYDSLAGVQVGDHVEVHGLLKADNQRQPYLQATLIAQRSAAIGGRLSGIVSQYDGRTFNIGATRLGLDGQIFPRGLALADGQLVTVWSPHAISSQGYFPAYAVRIKRPAPADGIVTLSGPISSYSSKISFQIRNVKVDASEASITPGTTLGNGTYVVVSGNYRVTTNRLIASSVTVFTKEAPTTVEVQGMVSSYIGATNDNPSTLTLRGVVIDPTHARFIGGTAAQLANGVFLKVQGAMADNSVRAATVEFVAFSPGAAPSDSIVEGVGIVTSASVTYPDPVTRMTAFSISTYNPRNGFSSMSGSLGKGTFYRNGTSANLRVGQAVNIAGTCSNNLLTGMDVTFIPGFDGMNPDPPMSGVAYNVTPTAFMLNGLTIQRNGMATPGDGLRGGSRISANVRHTGNKYYATAIYLLDG